MKQLVLLLLFSLGISWTALAQVAEIQGKVTDAKSGEPIPFANVKVKVNGSLAGAETDFDGAYSIKPIPPGSYTVEASLVGYNIQQINNVRVTADKITFLDIQLSESSTQLQEVVIVSYKVPLFEKDQTATGATVSKEDIQNMPTRDVSSIASQTAGVFQADEGSGLNVRGSRSEATDYYIDGIKVRGSSALPASAIEQLTVVTGGLPARYGDATGGIVNITTRGPSSEISGGIELSSSKFIEPYNYNLANFSLAGPLIKIGKADKRRTLLGYFVSGEYLHETDDDPSALGIWKVKDDVLQQIIANPLTPSPTGAGLETTASLLTQDNFEKVGAKQNVTKDNINIAGKLDFQPVNGINITLGSNFSYANSGAAGRSASYRDFMRRYELFNWEHTPLVSSNVYRVYGRFTQRFGNGRATNADDKTAKQSVLQNAYYSVQVDFTRSSDSQKDPIIKDNLFGYGYVGKFLSEPKAEYSTGLINIGNDALLQSTQLSGYSEAVTAYEPGGINPIKDTHNLAYFALTGNEPTTLANILTGKGYINGGLTPASLHATHSLWYVPGTHWNSYGYNQNDQYRLTFNGSFDLKPSGATDRNKHAIEFGFEYEQRVDRSFFLNPDQLWDFMYDNVARYNNGIELDLENPYLLINGERIALADYIAGQQGNGLPFNEYDTIDYNLIRTTNYNFDRNFREKFGLGDLDYANINAYSPDQYDLSMLSPDEMFNDGQNTNYTYHGYDYTGKKTGQQVDFQDFWTAKDENGMYTRPLDAFRPVYMAGFLQDKFAFRDMVFNVGLRVDRFDANQKTPKDIYSPMYGTRTAGEVSEFGAHPSTIGDDYVVYVDSEQNPTQIKGYRNGNNWYNADGLAVVDPIVLAVSTSTGTGVIPYLQPGQDTNAGGYQKESYNTSLAFEDYKPQISVMPRVAFSFDISDNAVFFAHYDVLTQRPQNRFQPTAKDFFFFDQTVQAGALENANLRPERTIDYQIGFKQKISKSSALTVSGFYRELKDMVQVINVFNAYPFNYTSYGNIDFGTVKGFELSYDLRRTQNLRMTIAYTMQFADGTGSGDRGQVNLLAAGLPNLRSIIPLDYDSRHLINVVADYTFGDGKDYNGPKLFGKNILANTGLNIIFRARSGTPYSRQILPTPEAQFGVSTRSALDGTINGSRLPFNSRLDLRFEKAFKFRFGKNSHRDPSEFSVYVITQNLLDTRNIINTYNYTGNPMDDGWVAYAQGISPLSQAFVDQYTLKVQNPNNFSIPRRVRVGLIYNF